MHKKEHTFPSISHNLRKAWALYNEKFNALVTISLFVTGFSFIVRKFPQVVSQATNSLELNSTMIYISAFVVALATYWGYLATIAIASEGDEILSIKEAFGKTRTKVLPVIFISIIVSFLISGAFGLFIIPGIIMYVWFVFAVFVYVLEGDRGIKALIKSREYVRGHWFDIFANLLTIIVLSILTSIFLSLGTQGFGESIGRTISALLQNIFLMPFVTVFSYSLFLEVKKTRGKFEMPATKPLVLKYFAVSLSGFIIFIIAISALFGMTEDRIYKSGFFKKILEISSSIRQI